MTTSDEKETRKKRRIEWHIGCHGALQAILVDYHDKLQYQLELPLYDKPLRLDNLIIKADPGLKIEKNIARHFRGHNIIEYKSYMDSLTVKKYHKAIAYAHLYPEIANINYNEVTLTCICTRHPRELFKDLRSKMNYKVTEPIKGIYTIKGERFPVRIIEVKRLEGEDRDDAIWFECLRRNAGIDIVSRAVEMEKSFANGIINIDAFWAIVRNANSLTLEGMSKMTKLEQQKWNEAMERTGIADIIRTRAEAIGDARATERTIQYAITIFNDFQQSRSPEWIARERGIDIQVVMNIINGISS